MKKILALVLALVMTLSLCSCGISDVVNRKITHGTVAGSVYTNDFLGFKFEAPDNWVYATDEELSSLIGTVADEVLDYSDLQQTMLNIQVVYDTMVQNANTGANMIVIYENLAISGSSDMTEDEYLELSKSQLDSVEFVSYTYGDVTSVKLGNTEFKRLEMTAVYYDIITFTQASYFAKIGDYMATITVTLTGDETIDEFESCFSAIE